MMLLAARAITNLLEAMPSSAPSIVNAGVIQPLVSNLLSIEVRVMILFFILFFYLTLSSFSSSSSLCHYYFQHAGFV